MDQFTLLKQQCNKHLLGHRSNNNMKKVYEELTNSIGDEEVFDRYGKGEIIEDFEKEIAKILGKEF